MKQFAHKLWVKILAFMICTAGGAGLVSSALGMSILAESGAYSQNKEEMQENAFDSIAANYCAMLLDHYNNNAENYGLDLLESVTDNLEYAVYYCSAEEADQYYWGGVMETEPLYQSRETAPGKYSHMFYGGTTFHGNYRYTDDMPKAMFSSGLWEGSWENFNDGEWIEAEVLYFLFDGKVFYAKTPDGYMEFPAVTIYKNVQGEQETIYCQIARPDTGTHHYTDSTNSVADLSDHETWTAVLICGVSFEMGIEVAYGDQIPEGTQSNKIVICRMPMDEDDIIQAGKVKYDNGSWSYFLPYADDGKNLQVFYNMPQKESLSDTPDLFSRSIDWIDRMYRFKDFVILILAVSVVCMIAGFVVLIYASGRRDAEGNIALRWPDRIPFAFLVFATIAIEAAFILCFWRLLEEGGFLLYGALEPGWFVLLEILVVSAFISVFLGFCMSLAARCKAKRFWRYTLLHYILIPVKAFWRMCRENVPLMAAVILGYLGICFVDYILLGFFYYNDDILPIFIEKACLGALVVVIAFQLHRLFQGGRRVALGDSSRPIDTVGMFYHFKKHGEDINRIGDGIAAAVERQMKSERLKTELITNVSHDIKTPLTSIINYVDLMKKEEITDPTILEYVDVLDRQSVRLKKLIEDLMEASKASTGNLNVNMETFDAAVLLTQFIGEFEERIQAAGLELVVSQPMPPVFIQADGRHLWRVVDNLMNNICKYAQPGTRVYIDMAVINDQVTIMFRNISSARLNISSDELMERFVRGDSSRNTEGSGLGLSIALSLMQLMGGTMQLDVDGDLFKVILAFSHVK